MDIVSILAEYADLELSFIPVNVDGVCINLKAPGRKPTVIVNKNKPRQRVRFTMAHELGHILIPWHIGLIVDNINAGSGANSDYWILETEANRFAAELLMPKSWVRAFADKEPNPVEVIRYVSAEADVSVPAAIIGTLKGLPPGYTYARSENNIVRRCANSSGTIAAPPQVGTNVDDYELSDRADARWSQEYGDATHCWWWFGGRASQPISVPDGDWREALKDILNDMNLNEHDEKTFRMSLNGVIGSANSISQQNRSVSSIYDACVQRLATASRSRPHFQRFVSHPRFEDFIRMKSASMYK